MKGKKLLIVILAMMMVFTFTACGGGGGGADEEVIFNIATTNGEDSLSFFNAESAKVEDWMHLMYDSLLEFDENYNAVPHVAESWENEGNDWTFHLRDDVFFSDGEKLTSEDVKYTYEVGVDSYLYSIYTERIESIECPDETTVVFHCADAKPDMLYQSMPIIPKHIWEAQEDPIAWEPEEIVGSGPFIYDPSASGNGVTCFVKNPDYWGEQPKVDTLVFTEYDNAGAMAQAMKIGEVDACYSLEKTQYDDLAGTEGIEVGQFDAWGFEYLGYNMMDELLADKVIRHAIDYCTDVEYIIEMSYGGIADVGYGPVNNAGYEYDPPADVKRGFNIDKANEILDTAGYKDSDGDGIREKDGKPLSFELITASHRSSWQQATVNSLIENCAKAGIEIKWNAMEVATMWDTCYDGNPDWQLNLDGWGGTMDPGYILQLFLDWENGGYATVAYSNPEFDKVYGEVFAATDTDERAKYIEEAQAILYEDCPYTYLCYDKTLQCINSDKWTGYKPYSNGFFGNLSAYNYTHIEPKA
jgi:peptide/nickel transport system substrate-binding protein